MVEIVIVDKPDFIPIFWLFGLLFSGLFAYMDHFSRDKRGPYIRNRVYYRENGSRWVQLGVKKAFRP